MGDNLTGQKTQPAVSKYRRKLCYKRKSRKRKHKIQQYNRYTYNLL